MSADVEVISKLPDRPNEEPSSLTSSEVKAKFDEAAMLLKEFINAHIDDLGRTSAAGNIGILVTLNEEPVPTTLQAIINELVSRSETATDDSVTTAAIQDGAVNEAKIGSLAVSTEKIKSNAVTGPKIATNAVSRVYNGILLVSAWDGSEAPYHQSVTIDGITATDEPIIDLVPSDTYDTAMQEDNQWGNIYKAVTREDGITFYAKEKPTVALSFKARCIRK